MFVDSFFAQHLAESVGLPDLIDPTHHLAQLSQRYPELRRYNADAEMTGAVTLALPGATQLPGSGGIFTGSNYLAAADLYQTGVRSGNPLLKQYGVQLGSAIAYQSWLRADNGFAYDAPDFWGETDTHSYTYPAYSQLMGVWDLMDAIKSITLS